MSSWSRSPVAAESDIYIVPLPPWTGILRFLRVAVALAFLGLIAAVTALFGGCPTFAVAVFAGSATLISSGYYLIAAETKPGLYNRWAVLTVEICSVVLWCASVGLLGEWITAHSGTVSWDVSDSVFRAAKSMAFHGHIHASLRRSQLPHLYLAARQSRAVFQFQKLNRYHAGEQLVKAAAGFAAVELLLSMVILTIFSLRLHKHRRGARFGAAYGSDQRTRSHKEESFLSVTAFAEPGDNVAKEKV